MMTLIRNWWATFLIVASILVLQYYHSTLFNLLNFDPAFIRNGEYWRLLTCHFLHLGWNHVWLNLAGYLIITYSFRDEIPGVMEIWTLLACGLGVGLGLFYFDPAMYSYAGLSGALHGFLLLHLIRGLHTTRTYSLLFIIAVIGKLAWEQSPYADTAATAELIGGFVAVNAHLAGGITGLVLGIIMYAVESRR